MLQNVLKLPHKQVLRPAFKLERGGAVCAQGCPSLSASLWKSIGATGPVAIKKGLGGKEDDLVRSKPGDLSLIPSAHIKVGEN